MPIHSLGYTDELHQLFAPYLSSDLSIARVIRADRGRYLISDGEREITAETSGRLSHDVESPAGLPAVGDWVCLRSVLQSGTALIDLVLPRKSVFRRKVAGARTQPQILAANIDWLWIVVGLDGDFSLRRIERYLVAAHDSGAEVAVLLNKADLEANAQAIAGEVRSIRAGLPVYVVSATTGQGYDELVAQLRRGVTYALVGSSGVGKSSLLNRLLCSNHFATAQVRSSDDRGCHTTTHRELVQLPCGALLMDMPGLREIALWANAEVPWDELFADIAELAEACRYRDCQHQSEPGCAVRAAIESGSLAPGRLQSYIKQQRELDYNRARQDQRARQVRTQRHKLIAQTARQLYKLRGKIS